MVVLRFGSAMAVIEEYLIFGGFNRASPTYTWTVYMYDLAFHVGDWLQGYAAAIGWIGACAMMVVVGGMLYILMHSAAKGGLFLCAGIVEHNVHTKDITKMGGLYKTMPWTAGAFIFCAFSVMGIPPFGGFFAKYLVIGGIVEAGNITLGIVFIIGAVMTVMYLIRLFVKVFLGPQTFPDVKENTPLMVTSVVILAVLSLALGIFISIPSALADIIGRSI
jgi:formate hydrogenlyase subunit 3/multisubunit Na+/H+ antiporter MnhD subunit